MSSLQLDSFICSAFCLFEYVVLATMREDTMASDVKWEDVVDHLKEFWELSRGGGTGKYFDNQLSKEEKKAQFVPFANFLGVNILYVANNAKLGRNAQQLIV